jgi:predicted RNA binding protein YcfA (HicA-like mRNA interferase family)
MSKLPRLTYRELTVALRQLDCEFRREAKGSHEIWWHPAKHLYTTIPNHPGTMDTGTVNKILNDLQVREQIIDLLN